MKDLATKTTTQYTYLRNYAVGVLGILFIFHVAAFFAVSWFERQEIRDELVEASRSAVREGVETDEFASLSHQDQIIRIERHSDEDTRGFYEKKIGDKEYYVYESPDVPFITAKYEGDVQSEIMKVGIVLIILYVAECIALFSWWTLLRSKVNEIFMVK